MYLSVSPSVPPCDYILLIAGETSGDILAASLIKGLREQGCKLPIWGVGGPCLEAQGMVCVETIDALAVRGYTEVLGALPRLWFLRKRLIALFSTPKPKLCITVDAPDFNLAFARKMKKLGVPTVHYISPSIWAWRKERLQGIKRAIDHMLCVFPFEPEIYQSAGMAASYIGHPMAQTIPMQIDKIAAKKALGLDLNSQCLTLLPGSRKAEIDYILPRMLASIDLIRLQAPHLIYVLPIASTAIMPYVESQLVKWPHLKIKLLMQQAGLALAAADVGMIASGTATLEAALYKLPMIITYVMPKTSWALMGKKGYQAWVGLPNILSGEFVVPEFLQDEASPHALAEACISLLNDSERQSQIISCFEALHHRLRCDTQTLSARAVMRML